MDKVKPAALAAKDLTVKIEGKTILERVNVSFTPAVRTAIIGPNGAGKSTLLKALAGLNHRYEGQVLLGEEDTKQLGRKAFARRLAILPQGMTVPADVTVSELVDYGRFPYRGILTAGDPKRDREAVEQALAKTHLEGYTGQRVMTLSGGERQRAFIAMALAQEPEILLLDEPTTYLDIGHQLEVMNIIQELNENERMTIVMVLHDINHALQYSDEIVVIKDHGIYRQGTPEGILTVDLLAEVFGVKADVFVNSQGIRVLSPISLAEEKSKGRKLS